VWPRNAPFDAVGRTTVWLDEVGAATRLKLVTHSWIAALNVAAGESVALARALGAGSRRWR
jgi:3-hydroxyisobutyrate dehydrogenase